MWALPTNDRWGETPSGYQPEPWSVVRDDGTVIIARTEHLDAETQCAWLNARASRGHSYDIVLAVEQGDET